MKIKKLLGMLMCGVLMFNTIPVGAFTNSCEGQWGNNTGVNYKYNSDGTLIISGETGTESISWDSANTVSNAPSFQELGANWSTDVKSVFIDNLSSVFTSNELGWSLFNAVSHNISYAYLNAEEIGQVFQGVSNIDTIVLGDDVKSIGKGFIFSGNTSNEVADFTIHIPSTVTSISTDALSVSSSWVFNMTVVCEYGSAAYNWAVAMSNRYTSSTINIELMDVLAQSNVVVDNSQNYQVVVPETISFEKSADGWFGDSFLGIVGKLNGSITVKTNKSFKVVGEDDPSSENVTVSTNNASTTEDNGFLKTTITKQDLEDASDEIDINGTPTQGYLIDYDCKVDSERIMRQKYTGTLYYIISE